MKILTLNLTEKPEQKDLYINPFFTFEFYYSWRLTVTLWEWRFNYLRSHLRHLSQFCIWPTRLVASPAFLCIHVVNTHKIIYFGLYKPVNKLRRPCLLSFAAGPITDKRSINPSVCQNIVPDHVRCRLQHSFILNLPPLKPINVCKNEKETLKRTNISG